MNPGLRIERELHRQGYATVAGCDEAGRGPLAGPVVCAAVTLPEKIRANGIDDCKLLTPSQRLEMFEYIKARALSYKIVCVHQQLIDRFNILQASLLGMRLAVENLPAPPDFVIVDGNQELPDLTLPQRAIVRGDRQSLSIAAASILAKVTRDRIMDIIDGFCPQYHFARHKGYATRLHKEAILKFGISCFHRKSFKLIDDDIYIQERLPLEETPGAEIR